MAENQAELILDDEIPNDDNNLNINDMDLTEKLYAKQEENHSLQIKLALLQKDFENFDKLKKELEQSELKLQAFKDQNTELKNSNQKLDSDLKALATEKDEMRDGITELVLTCLILQSKGLPDFAGKSIKYEDVVRLDPDFEFTIAEDFTVTAGVWRLTHKKDAMHLIISNK